ncbi:hypothetical protein C7N43_38835 [Sphingobacteriales bacterium UPWRP_1]|nr:hypothetical protein C7N43_38835 [Sphingobacteriales bacterium UPWRP_1]
MKKKKQATNGFEQWRKERTKRVASDHSDTGLADGITAIKSNAQAYYLVKAAYNFLPSRRMNEFGLHLKHLYNIKAGTDQTAEVASIINEFIDKPNVKPVADLKRELQQAQNLKYLQQEIREPEPKPKTYQEIKSEIENLENEITKKEAASIYLLGKKKGSWRGMTDADINRSIEISKLKDRLMLLKLKLIDKGKSNHKIEPSKTKVMKPNLKQANARIKALMQEKGITFKDAQKEYWQNYQNNIGVKVAKLRAQKQKETEKNRRTTELQSKKEFKRKCHTVTGNTDDGYRFKMQITDPRRKRAPKKSETAKPGQATNN